MKHLILAAALSLAAVPAFAQDYHPSSNNPNNPASSTDDRPTLGRRN